MSSDWDMARALDAVDVQLFRAIYCDRSTPLEEMCENYVRNVGFRRINILKSLRQRICVAAGKDIFDSFGRLNPEHIPARLGSWEDIYIKNVETLAPETFQLIDKSDNELFDNSFPEKLRFCLARQWREGLALYNAPRAKLYCDVFNWQVFDDATDTTWASANPFSLSKLVSPQKTHKIRGTAIFVGDIFDGTNFSHFLFDYITRIGHFLESGILKSLSRSGEFVFIMGGIPGPFQAIATSVLCTLFGLEENKFIYPSGPTIYLPTEAVSWFSDAAEHNQHPAQLMHPRSVALLRRCSEVVKSQRSPLRKLFISRSDAAGRRIENEAELENAIKGIGFSKVVLSKMPMMEQIALVRGADVIVSPHGMALTHCAFHFGPLKLVELFNPTVGTDAYAALARAMGFDYHYVLGNPGHALNDFTINVEEVLSHL